jgi:hypothetical protein
MKFGVREICDVVFRAKAPMKVGNKIFYKNEPVIYFDTLKTSTLEGAATTVYAQGGRGNARLMSWDGERTVTFTMEDALISPEGLAILTGAGLFEATAAKPIYIHSTETMAVSLDDEDKEKNDVDAYVKYTAPVRDKESGVITTPGKIEFTRIPLTEPAVIDGSKDAHVYVMLMDGEGNVVAEPFSSAHTGAGAISFAQDDTSKQVLVTSESTEIAGLVADDISGYMILVDYYVEKTGGAMEINITPDKFGGAFYIEASTLFREYPSQMDLPAEFIIPNGRVQSNFTFTMAGSGDPSTFTFTVDAFPDYTKFNKKEKVLASIQVVGGGALSAEVTRQSTNNQIHDEVNGLITKKD